MTDDQGRSVRDVIEQEGADLLDLAGVVGVAETEVDGKPAILVMLESDGDLASKIKPTLGGYPVVVEQSGVISAQDRESGEPA